MLSKLLRTTDAHRLLQPDDRVLVAISGGPDSTALLHGLRLLAPRLDITLAAATVDHGLRAESAGEAALVAARCEAAGVPCAIVPVDVRAARGPHVSWQDAARRARLAALEAEAVRSGCAAVALGHTADDQAETLLFRIVRGTGVAGLGGVPYRRGKLVRPLLDVCRDEVLRFLRRHGLPYIEDPSNADRRFARARVRHEWIPLLARENPRLVDALLALSRDARRVVSARPGTPTLAGLSRRAAATVERLALRGAGTRVVSIAGGEVEISYGRISVRARGKGATAQDENAGPRVIPIEGAGTYRIGGGPALDVALGERAAPPADCDGAVFDLEGLVLPLCVRPWNAGDRMRPRGGRGSRKLSDLLIDAKVPRPIRAELPVLTAADGTILFVPGLRPAETGRPGASTKRWIQVSAR